MRNNRNFAWLLVALAVIILAAISLLLVWSKSEDMLSWRVLYIDYSMIYDSYEIIYRVLNVLLLVLLVLFIYIQKRVFKWVGIFLVGIAYYLLEMIDFSPF